MHPNRFELALERLGSAEWEKFEKLASVFLSTEFPDLRTLASQSGDAGRDAILYSAQEEAIAIQFSITLSWENKILRTAKILTEKHPSTSILIYVTNQLIGAKADGIRQRLRREHKLSLDIRDRNWFLERVNTEPAREIAAETLAEEIVDPYLADKQVTANKSFALSDIESRAAFVFLRLQLEDDTKEKGLTRLSFEALVRAALQGTSSENRKSRSDIYQNIQLMLPNHPAEVVKHYTETALNHLTKKIIRYYQATDEFCLTHDESQRLNNRLSDVEKANSRLNEEITLVAQRELGDMAVTVTEKIVLRVRRILEMFLFYRGESFVSNIHSGIYNISDFHEISKFIYEDIKKYPLSKEEKKIESSLIHKISVDVLNDPGTELRVHLRTIANAYTLLAFLKETPDVQSAVNKMFSHGDIWFDTNIILPLLAEELLPKEHRRFQSMLDAAYKAGIKFHITSGVLEEIERHMNLSLSCSNHRTSSLKWEGTIPFLYSVFIQTGSSAYSFPNWIEIFRGDVRPEDDIAQYLSEKHNIHVTDLAPDVSDADQVLWAAVQNAWHTIHEKRRVKTDSDSLLAARLATHDINNFLGVLQRRKNEKVSSVGYSSWWITLDSAAFNIAKDIQKMFKNIRSPVMSPDFLTNYLALGPIRMKVPGQMEKLLPVALELSKMDSISLELLDVAQTIRDQYKEQPEHVIRRKVRDELDAAKSRQGQISYGGLQAIEEELIRASKLL